MIEALLTISLTLGVINTFLIFVINANYYDEVTMLKRRIGKMEKERANEKSNSKD